MKKIFFRERRTHTKEMILLYSSLVHRTARRSVRGKKRERKRSLMNHPLFIYRFTKLSCNSPLLSIDDRLAIIIWKEFEGERETITACTHSTQDSCLLWNIPLSFFMIIARHEINFVYTATRRSAMCSKQLWNWNCCVNFFRFFPLLVCSVFVFQSSLDKNEKGKINFLNWSWKNHV